MDLKRVKTVRISTSLLRWDADRGKRWWTFLTFFQITQAQWFTSWACLVTEWATGPQIGSPGGAGVFRIIAWAWGGFYLSIRWYWGWTLKSDKLLKIADMHSILFGRSWHIWLWSWHKGSSAEAPPNSTFLHSSLPYTFPPPYPQEERRCSSFSHTFELGVVPRRCVVRRCPTLNIPLCSSQLCEQWVLIENLGDECSTVTPLHISKDLRIWQL